MCLAQGHNTVTLVRLENAAPRSQVKHSTTEQLCSLLLSDDNLLNFLISQFFQNLLYLDPIGMQVKTQKDDNINKK